MFNYFVFLIVVYAILLFGNYTRKHGFENLNIKREVDKAVINEGEEFKISIIIENNKRLPISFLLLKEIIPKGLEFQGDGGYHTSRYSILWFQRIRRTYSYKALKRGTYLLKEIYVELGDVFGFYTEEKLIEDYVELLVYPKFTDMQQLKISNTSLYGDNIIKRWIYKDPLYIRGIRQYNQEDRMSDIHWKSSLKMNKLMVKEYDYTSEFELVIILNVQCSDPYWQSINTESVELGISIAASLARQSVKEGVAVGFWTDAKLLSYKAEVKNEIEPSLNSLKKIMQIGARIDYSPRKSFDEYLLQRSKYFKTNCTYIIIASYLNEKSLGIISMLKKAGYSIKLIDTSKGSSLAAIAGIEKLDFKRMEG